MMADERLMPIPYAAAFAEPTVRTISPKHFLRAWRRHMWLSLLCFFGVLILGGVVLKMLKPSYTATAVVAISLQNADPLAPSGQQAGDATGDDDLPATEATIMQSRDVAAAVLAQFPPPAEAPGFSLKRMACQAGITALCPKPVPMDPDERLQAEIDEFLNHLTAVPILHSRIINVSVTAATGERAAALADAVVANYQRISLTQQTENVNGVASWLDTRTSELQQRWLNAVHTADAYSVAHNLTNANDGVQSNPLVDTQITNMAGSLGDAQAALAAAKARAATLRGATHHGDATALVSLPDQPILVSAADTLIQLESERNQLAAEFGPDYPKIKALDQQIVATRETVNEQTGAALASVGQSLSGAQSQVDQLTENLNQLRAQAAGQSAPLAEYRSLAEEATNAQTIYQTFLQHSDEVVDRAALLEPPVVLVSHAGVPAHPTFPNKPKLALAIFVLAVVAGIGSTLVADHFSDGFAEADDLRAAVPLPLLATLPFLAAGSNRTIARHVLEAPFSRTSEAVRGLASKLSLLAADATMSRAVLVVSAGPLEGKSTLTAWLAMTVRKGGQAVIVIDGDHRRGVLMQDNNVPVSKLGLTDLLSGSATAAQIVQTDPVTKVDFIAAGSAMSRPFGAEEIGKLRDLIASLRLSYGLIVIDSPPLLAMTDGLVYGSVADQTVFVCRWQQTSRSAVIGCLNRLHAFGVNVSGIVVSMVAQKSALAFDGDYSQREQRLINQLYDSTG
jgi:succinoglycan biosynthesis transport protein ExoP